VPNVADLTIRQGDTTPTFTEVLTDQNGNQLNLTGATCTFVMREMYSAAPVVNAAMTITNPTYGIVTYNWSSTDTATAGLYMGEIHVVLSGGGTFTYPNDGYLTIAVEENLLAPNQTLVSLGDAKDVLNVPASDHSHDTKILQFIRAVQVIVEAQIGAVVPRLFDEWYDGGSAAIRLRYRPSTALGTTPLLNLVACSEYIGPIEWPLAIISSPDQGQMYSCMLDVATGTVVRRTAGGAVQAFARGPQSVHMVYEAGQSRMPANVYEGTCELLREHYQQTQQVGAPGPGGNQMDEHEALGELVSAKVWQWISPMRRHPSVA
jgi:hypothetical protein